MSFLNLLKYLLITIVASFYLFPFTFRFLPGINTKMILAGIGLILYVLELAKGRSGKVNKSLFILSIAALLVSFIAFISAIVNNTNDYTYADYIISMWVWLGGAYTVIWLIKRIYGKVTVDVVCNSLISVCVLQCFLALVIDSSIPFKMFVDSIIADLGFVQMDRLGDSNRLYGIGCSLDVAGTRFAAVLTTIPFLTIKSNSMDTTRRTWLYLLAFVFIAIVGNMIARTTIIGVLVAILIWILMGIMPRYKTSVKGLWPRIIFIIIIATIFSVILYNSSNVFKTNIRFAFEGFFSLFESGRWQTNSNNILMNMFILPDNLHTWLIGDGYLYDPSGINPYYVGDNYPGYYMNTDVGYIRFIFYFGIIGLMAIVGYFFVITKQLSQNFPDYNLMFYVILLINLIVWIKVSTDIFPIYAAFFCIPADSNAEIY